MLRLTSNCVLTCCMQIILPNFSVTCHLPAHTKYFQIIKQNQTKKCPDNISISILWVDSTKILCFWHSYLFSIVILFKLDFEIVWNFLGSYLVLNVIQWKRFNFQGKNAGICLGSWYPNFVQLLSRPVASSLVCMLISMQTSSSDNSCEGTVL